jgi:uncharacterized membrane protein
MAHAEGSITINQPVNSVFDFVLDGTNNPLWRSTVVDIQRVPGKPTDVGAVFKQGLKGPGGRCIDGDYEIVESKLNELIKFQVITGPARPNTLQLSRIDSSVIAYNEAELSVRITATKCFKTLK